MWSASRATVIRKDGHHPIIFMQCGPVRYRVDAKQQAAARPFTHAVVVRPTNFRMIEPPQESPRLEFIRCTSRWQTITARNQLICGDVLDVVREGRRPLVLTERTEHLGQLAELLAREIPQVIVLQGGMSRKELQSALNRMNALPDDAQAVLLATGRFIGEGFDDPRLDTLFIALPVSWRGTVAQYVAACTGCTWASVRCEFTIMRI